MFSTNIYDPRAQGDTVVVEEGQEVYPQRVEATQFLSNKSKERMGLLATIRKGIAEEKARRAAFVDGFRKRLPSAPLNGSGNGQTNGSGLGTMNGDGKNGGRPTVFPQGDPRSRTPQLPNINMHSLRKGTLEAPPASPAKKVSASKNLKARISELKKSLNSASEEIKRFKPEMGSDTNEAAERSLAHVESAEQLVETVDKTEALASEAVAADAELAETALQMAEASVKTAERQEKTLRSKLELELISAMEKLEFMENDVKRRKDELKIVEIEMESLNGEMAMERLEIQQALRQQEHQLRRLENELSSLVKVHLDWPYEGKQVSVAGSFNSWGRPFDMGPRGADGKFSIDLMLLPGRYEYKFVVDGNWWVDLAKPRTRGGGIENNELMVQANPRTYRR
mmetsp:Transcript_2961/g.10687  ORF Transcript_2961/g.10687 Transcript_2961/m.10687 type:complete len:397 (+) Transcript_2961:234-1424(+)